MLQIANVVDLENVAPTMSGSGRLRCKILRRNLLVVVVFLAGCLDRMHDDNLAEIQSQGSGARVFKADEIDAFLKFMEAK